MTTFAELVSNVVALTVRPDLVAETNLAIQLATLKAHQHDDFIRDLGEYSIQFTTADYYQTLDYKVIIPLWRKPYWLRKYDFAGSAPSDFLRYITPDKVTDEFGYNREDIYYVAGSNIQIRSSTSLEYLLLSCYLNPSVTIDAYSSWVADEFPAAIIYEAVAAVYKVIGNLEESNKFTEMAKEARADLVRHAVTGM